MATIEQRLPQGVTHIREESIDLQEAINKAVSERLEYNSKTKLTWDPENLPVRGAAKMLGKELCLSLPYILVERRYYIQNMRVFRPNGDRIDLEDVFDLEGGGPIYLRVKEAYEKMSEDAGRADPNLCRHCWLFTATSSAQYLTHMVTEHPDVVADIARGRTGPGGPAAMKIRYKCTECEKDFQSQSAMAFHREKRHKVGDGRYAAPPKTEPIEDEATPEPEL